jgi:hypothetical protein
MIDAQAMIKNPIPSKRKTVTLTVSRWEAIEAYKLEHGIRTFTGTLDRLVAAGLSVKVAVVGKNAKRKAI